MNKTVEQLYRNKNVKHQVERFAGKESTDLIHECIVILYESPFCKINNAIKGGYLEGFFLRICWNQYIGKRTSFAKKYRNEFCELLDMEAEVVADDAGIIEVVSKSISSFDSRSDWFNKKILKMVAEQGSVKAVSTITGIPYMDCYRAQKKAIDKIKHDLRNYND